MGLTATLDAALVRLEQVESRDALQSVIEALRDHYRVDHLVYHWVNGHGEQFGCGTYDPVWVVRYLERGYLRIDPVVIGCNQKFHPVDWKSLDWSGRAARDLWREAADHGVGNQGLSIPIRGPNGQFAVFTINTNDDDGAWARFTDLHRGDLLLIAHLFNHKALELEPGRVPPASQPLSPRELEAMTLIAAGLSRAQAADELAISEHTLRVYIESARHKLGALNTTHAVARALHRGLIVA